MLWMRQLILNGVTGAAIFAIAAAMPVSAQSSANQEQFTSPTTTGVLGE